MRKNVHLGRLFSRMCIRMQGSENLKHSPC